MSYRFFYKTPDGLSDIWMSSDGDKLTGLLFEGSKSFSMQHTDSEIKDLPIFRKTCRWLDIYFSGEAPDFIPDIKFLNATPFRQEVLELLLEIPYGKTTTYGHISKRIADAHGMDKMSSRAVGGAVGWNPICIIVPCHRVIGANNSLTGYSGGMNNKIGLLKAEGFDMKEFIIPKYGTAL